MKRKKKLPIGFSSFVEVISGNCVYIDKTHHIHALVEAGKYYFLARPRRFGKSLFVDTIKQAFMGNKALFEGLYLEKHWDWSVINPVIHLDLGRGVPRDREEMERNIHTILDEHFNQFKLESTYTDVANRLNDLIQKIFYKTKQHVVILIDEYDKPLLDTIEQPEIATSIREGLKNFYGIIKINDQYIKFAFLTGVSKFSKVSLFSGLNNLQDISLHEKYADICGYTQKELDASFKPYLPGVNKDKLKYWYNGYDFAGKFEQKVYNPFDILLFFGNEQEYQNYWIQTGNPSFLFKLLQNNHYYLPNLERLNVNKSLLDSFDIQQLAIEPLLFQTGYLTIQDKTVDPLTGTIQYRLNYPNHEVRLSLNEQLMNYFITDKQLLSFTKQRLQTAFMSKDFDLLKQALMTFFASIPYFWYTKNQLVHYEGFYASMLYSLLNGMGLDAIPEDTTNHGRIDLSVKILNYYLLFEFKVQKDATASSAIDQIKQKKYPEKYAAEGMPIYIIGMVFDEKERNVVDFAWEHWRA